MKKKRERERKKYMNSNMTIITSGKEEGEDCTTSFWVRFNTMLISRTMVFYGKFCKTLTFRVNKKRKDKCLLN